MGRILQLIVINFLVLLTGLFLLEHLLPVISLPIYSERTINLREHSPNQNKTFKTNKTNQQVEFVTDTDGFLNHLQNDADSFILFFGGSTVENIQVQYKERMTSRLQSKLNRLGDKKIQVLNGGVSGNNNINSLFSFLSKGVKYKPKYVFLMGTLNDISQLSKHNSYWSIDNNQSVLNSKKNKGFVFLNYLKTHWFTNIYYHLKSMDILPKTPNENENKFKFNDSSKEEYLRIISLFNTISKEFDIEFVFLTEPYLKIPDKEKKVVDTLHHSILNSDVNVLDLESLIPKEKRFFIDNTHLNAAGNERASKVIFDFIQNNKQ